jgi:hypothetical protein
MLKDVDVCLRRHMPLLVLAVCVCDSFYHAAAAAAAAIDLAAGQETEISLVSRRIYRKAVIMRIVNCRVQSLLR